MKSWLPLIAIGSFLIGAIGCSDDGLRKVTGKVSYKGESAPMGRITFYPAEGAGRSASGRILDDSTYELSSFKPGDGVPPGDYTVAISVAKTPSGSEYGSQGRIEWFIPEQYANRETTPLTVTVSDGVNVIDFALPEEER